eukprot:4269118-Prymnesium_polylepis.1
MQYPQTNNGDSLQRGMTEGCESEYQDGSNLHISTCLLGRRNRAARGRAPDSALYTSPVPASLTLCAWMVHSQRHKRHIQFARSEAHDVGEFGYGERGSGAGEVAACRFSFWIWCRTPVKYIARLACPEVCRASHGRWP